LLDELYRMTEADPSKLAIPYKAPIFATDATTLDGRERRPLLGSQAQSAENIATYGKLGVSELVFDFRTDDLTRSLERMERFGATIMHRR
jgi:hypothetical protein